MGYDPTVNPSASNVFATAAFRFGHATISTVVRRFNESFQTHEQFTHLRLHHTFFSPWRIVKEGGIEPVLRGLMGTAATSVSTDKLIAEEMTEKLVVLNIQWKLDLAALNLQRGRDHALAASPRTNPQAASPRNNPQAARTRTNPHAASPRNNLQAASPSTNP
ncbi:unnamed protein product [Gadus morhua 'NCC']